MEVWKSTVDPPAPVQVTHSGAYRPLVSPDGQFVYYTKKSISGSHGAPLFRLPLDGSAAEEQVFERLVFHPENFDVSANRIYYATGISSHKLKHIHVFDLKSGTDRRIADIGPAIPRPILSVSPDGRALYFSFSDYHNADLIMFEGLE